MICQSLDDRPLGSYHACVVGSGPAGLSLALELSRSGMSVLVIESGGAGPDSSQQMLSEAVLHDPLKHDEVPIVVSRRLGGTSNLWGGRCQPLDPVDFMPRPKLRPVGWPISREELLPFYRKACAYLSAGEPVFREDIPDLSLHEDGFDCARLERFSNRPAIHKAFRPELASSPLIDIRLRSTVVDLDIVDRRVVGVIVANRDGSRITVRRPSAVVLAAGGLETTRLLLTLQGKHPALFGGVGGPLGRYYMGHIRGEIADVTFDRAFVCTAYDFHVDSNGSYVRRRFIPSDNTQIDNDLLNVSFWPVVPPIADARHGSGILSMVCLALAVPPLGRRLVAETLRRRHIPPDLKWMPHVANVLRAPAQAARYLPYFFYNRYFSEMRLPGFFLHNPGRRYGLSFHAEQSPRPESRVWLSDATDRLGLHKLEIDLRFHREDAEALVRAHDLLGQWLQRNNIGCMDYRQPREQCVDAVLEKAFHGAHQIGTARMGSDRSSAVVDKDLRTFDVENLFVAGSATFPTSGQCNPTLTICALAVRLAHHLAQSATTIHDAE